MVLGMQTRVYMLLVLPLIGLVSGAQFSMDGSPYLLVSGLAFLYAILNRLKVSLKRSLIGSYLFGYGFFLYSHSWISTPLTSFGDMYSHLQPISYVMVPALLSLYFLLVGWVNYLLRKDGGRRVVSMTVGLLVVEFLRCEVAPAVPLGQIGTSWLFHSYMAQSASLFGVYGLSFVTIFMGFALGQVRWEKSRSIIPDFMDIAGSYIFYLTAQATKSRRFIDPDTHHVDTFPALRYTRSFWIGVLIFSLLSAWGVRRMISTPLVKRDAQVRLVPTNWRQQDKYKSLENRAAHLNELVHASTSNLPKSVEMIAWPETTIEFQLQKVSGQYNFAHLGVLPYLQAHLPPRTVLLAGGVLREGDQPSAYNVVFGVGGEQGLFYIYKKQHLAPFGEFMPSFLKPVTKALKIRALDDFARGEACQPPLALPSGLKVKPVICYEGSFSRRILHLSNRPDLFVVGTNDVWFNENGKEQQFISHAFRAIEEGIPMVRVANSGFSGYISPLGGCFFDRSSEVQDVSYHNAIDQTFFRTLSDLFVYWIELCLFCVIFLLVVIEVRRQRKG